MKLHRLEKWLMNTWLRAWTLQQYEAPQMFAGIRLAPGAVCLEIGCGPGMGALLFAGRVPGCQLLATDYDPAMIEQAQAVLVNPPRWAAGIQRDRIELGVADATELPFPDACVNAVFAFGILHHIQNWPRAIREAHRVLKPGGVFSCGEFFTHAVPLLRATLALAERFGIHPYVVISEREFKAVFGDTGFTFDTYRRWAGLPVGCFVVARKGQG